MRSIIKMRQPPQHKAEQSRDGEPNGLGNAEGYTAHNDQRAPETDDHCAERPRLVAEQLQRKGGGEGRR